MQSSRKIQLSLPRIYSHVEEISIVILHQTWTVNLVLVEKEDSNTVHYSYQDFLFNFLKKGVLYSALYVSGCAFVIEWSCMSPKASFKFVESREI